MEGGDSFFIRVPKRKSAIKRENSPLRATKFERE